MVFLLYTFWFYCDISPRHAVHQDWRPVQTTRIIPTTTHQWINYFPYHYSSSHPMGHHDRDHRSSGYRPPPAETPPNRMYVPLALRQRVIQWVHSTLSSGHPGIAATVQLLTNHFWWSTLQADTITYIRNCSTCNVSKPSHQLPAGLLQPLPIPRRPWSHIAIDFTLSGGHTTILTGVSHYTDYLASTLSYTPCKVLFCYCWHFWAFSPKWVFLLTTWTVYSHLTICCLPFWPWLPFGYTLCLPPALTFALTLFMNLPCLCYSCYCWLNFACLTSSLK